MCPSFAARFFSPLRPRREGGGVPVVACGGACGDWDSIAPRGCKKKKKNWRGRDGSVALEVVGEVGERGGRD